MAAAVTVLVTSWVTVDMVADVDVLFDAVLSKTCQRALALLAHMLWVLQKDAQQICP